MSFFTFWCQLFHLFLADWGFPSLGINQFHAGCGIATTIIFVLLLSQAENDLPPHGQCIAGTEPVPLIKVRTWLCTMLLHPSVSSSFCFTYIFFLLASFEIISSIPSHSYQIYFFITILITALLFPYFPLALPFFLPLCFKRSSVIQAILWRML